MIILFFIIIGLVTGVFAGLLGIGGGIITVPAMFYLFNYYQYPQDHLMHTCIATALAATIVTSFGSTLAHHKKKAVLPSVLKLIIPGLISGSILGAIVSTYLPSSTLQIIFGSMAILFSIYFFFPKLPPLHIAQHPHKSLLLFGVGVGCLSSLLGIGGGIFMVPILLGYHVPIHNTVASSSAGTLVTAFVGTVMYLFIAKGQISLPDMVGYIDIPAFLAIGVCSLITASWGCKLAHTLPPILIKRIFAIALAATGCAMILGK